MPRLQQAAYFRPMNDSSHPSHPSARSLILPVLLLLSGCGMVVLDPSGDVARQQRDIIVISTALMLLIIVPVLVLTVVFAWHYRARNRKATYDPDFHHSMVLELVIWSAPLLIIICLGALTWSSTHLLDPFRRLDRLGPGAVGDVAAAPMRVQVVSLDWKWLFIYPDLGIATVNELAVPVDRQVRFDITSTNMMNTFYAPTLAGMIYAMPGMQSTLHAVLNKPGNFDGYSANYSGVGFSDMHFRLRGLDGAAFDQWVAAAKASPLRLDAAAYAALLKPSVKNPAALYAAVDGSLFRRIVERCVEPGKPCMSDMMRHDQKGHEHGGPLMPPGRDSLPVRSEDTTGAQLRGDNGPAPDATKPDSPAGARGSTGPENHHNRDHSSRDPHGDTPIALVAAHATGLAIHQPEALCQSEP